MSTDPTTGMWSAQDSGQFIHYAGFPVAMADMPHRASEIVASLNAQEAGQSLAARRFNQRLADVRAEFERRLVIADRAAHAWETGTLAAVAERMSSALRLIGQHGCTSFTAGRCWDAGLVRGAEYGAAAWCDACVAADALGVAR